MWPCGPALLVDAPPGSTWNPLDKDASYTLSESNRKATQNSGASPLAIVRGVQGQSSGKKYFEVLMGVITSPNWNVIVGVANASAPLNNWVGQDSNGWGYQSQSNTLSFKRYNGVATAYGISYSNGHIVGIAVDFSTGEITFYVNNTSYGVAFSSVTGTVYPAWGSLYSGNNGRISTRFADLFYSPPSGYTAWG